MNNSLDFSALQESSWVCSLCNSNCNNEKVKKLDPKIFNELIFAISYDIRLFFGLAYNYLKSVDKTLCLIRNFFYQAAIIKKPLSNKQKSAITDFLSKFINIWSESESSSLNIKKQSLSIDETKELESKGHDIQKEIDLRCPCGKKLIIRLPESEIKMKSKEEDPFGITVLHKTPKSENCAVIAYISKYGELRGIEKANDVVSVE